MGIRSLVKERGLKGSLSWFWLEPKGYDEALARLYYRSEGFLRFFLWMMDLFLTILEIIACMFLLLICTTLLIIIVGFVPRSPQVAVFSFFLLAIVIIFLPLALVATGRSVKRQIHFKRKIMELWSENAN